MTEGGGAPAPAAANGAALPFQVAAVPVAQPVPGVIELNGQQYQPVPVAEPAGEQPAVQVVTPAQPVQPVQQQPVQQQPEGVAPTLGQRIRGATANKGQLVAERDGFRQRAEQAEATNQQLRAELLEAQSQLSAAQGQLQEVEQALATTQEQVTTVGERATEQVAEAGFPAEQLPEQKEAPVDTIEAIKERLKDRNLHPKERFELDEQLEQLEEEAKKSA